MDQNNHGVLMAVLADDPSALDAHGHSREAIEVILKGPPSDADRHAELRESLKFRLGITVEDFNCDPPRASSPLLQSLERWKSGRRGPAIVILQRFLKRHPNHLLSRLQLGLFYMAAGQANEAETTLQLLIDCPEPYQPACFAMARLRMASADWKEALRLLRSVPDGIAQSGERVWLIADCYRGLGKRSTALEYYRHAEEASCCIPLFWCRYSGYLSEDRERQADAVGILERGDPMCSYSADYAVSAAHVCRQMTPCRTDLTDKWLRIALERGADRVKVIPDLIYNACRRFQGGKNPAAIQEALSEAIDFHRAFPDEPEAAFALGNTLFYFNRITEGLEIQRSGFRDAAREWIQKSVHLFHCNYDETLSPIEVFRRHRELGKEFENALSPLPPSEVDLVDGEPLRIGFVSPDLRNHPVGYFLDAVCEHFDEKRIRCFFYATKTEEGEVSERFRARPGWRSIVGISDVAAAERIRADRIHVLVDLAGYTTDHRMPLFAIRPAPVQVSWLGYPGCTGLSRIDYRISDDLIDPPGEADTLSAARIYRLPNGFHAFRPPFPYPRVMPLPALREGVVTFGCFNNLRKVNARVLAVWAQILHAVPKSRLLIKHDLLSVPANRAWVHNAFSAFGVASERIHLKGRTETLAKHAGCYNWLDIALDPFPYNGTTTTCESLYMGVPVISLAGDRHAARVSASFMRRIGLSDWVAPDLARYVRIAAEKAADLSALAALRTTLRTRFIHSPLGNPGALAADLDHAFYAMWRECSSNHSDARRLIVT